MFIVLAGTQCYPRGADDYFGAFETEEEAKQAIEQATHDEGRLDSDMIHWIHIIDTSTEKIQKADRDLWTHNPFTWTGVWEDPELFD